MRVPWQTLDRAAHILYAPTMLGQVAVKARWHHHIHLIPGWLLGWVCNRYDLWFGVTPGKLRRARPATSTTTNGDAE